MMVLNLGSGTDVRQGCVNVDLTDAWGADVVHDLDEAPWPFPDESFDHVLALDVMEHLRRPLQAFEESWRVLRPGGTINVRVPHWLSPDYRRDLTHQGFPWCEDTFRWLCEPSEYIDTHPWDLVWVRALKPWNFWRRSETRWKWWRWGRWGNVEAVLEKVVP